MRAKARFDREAGPRTSKYIYFPQDALEDAHAAGRAAEVAAWRRRLHGYLDALFRLQPDAAAEYHYLQVAACLRFVQRTLLTLPLADQSIPCGRERPDNRAPTAELLLGLN